MPMHRHAPEIWRALLAAGVLIGIYIGQRATRKAIARLTTKVDGLSERVRADYWQVYADVQADLLSPNDRR